MKKASINLNTDCPMGAERSVSSYQPVSGTKDTIDEQSNRDPVLAALIVATNEK